jgi:hypothetical protein
MGNRTGDLPTCSIVPQPTMWPHALEGTGCNLIWGVIIPVALRDWGNPQSTLVRWANLLPEIETQTSRIRAEVLPTGPQQSVCVRVFICILYREVLTFVDQFIALRFTATGAPPAARCIRILLMANNVWNQGKLLTLWTAWQHYVSRPAARFMRANLFMICQQRAAVISSIGPFFCYN